MPSIRSPSEHKAKTRWVIGRKASPSTAVRASSILAASAMPTELATPCPSGPVVVSMPGVSCTSGWPGVMLPHWRKRLRSAMPTP